MYITLMWKVSACAQNWAPEQKVDTYVECHHIQGMQAVHLVAIEKQQGQG